jgi:hypothetical protein
MLSDRITSPATFVTPRLCQLMLQKIQTRAHVFSKITSARF